MGLRAFSRVIVVRCLFSWVFRGFTCVSIVFCGAGSCSLFASREHLRRRQSKTWHCLHPEQPRQNFDDDVVLVTSQPLNLWALPGTRPPVKHAQPCYYNYTAPSILPGTAYYAIFYYHIPGIRLQSLWFSLLFFSVSILVVTQPRGRITGSSLHFPLPFVPWISIARELHQARYVPRPLASNCGTLLPF